MQLLVYMEMLQKLINAYLYLDCVSDHYYVKCLPADAVVIDFGAGAAEFSESMMKKHPNARFVLVEPDPGLFATLVNLYSKNSNVQLVHAAVSDRIDDHSMFYLNEDFHLNSLQKVECQLRCRE